MDRIKLSYPYSWEERRPLISEGVLFIPEYYFLHNEWTFPAWNSIFGNDNPVFIEYGSGNGMWLIDRASRESSVNWIAVEYRFERVRKIWNKREKRKLNNLFIVCGDAHLLNRWYLPCSSVDGAFVNFPDPWPKLKHAHHRLFQKTFVEDLSRLLKPSSQLIAVTDDENYGYQIQRETLSHSSFESIFPEPYFVTSWEGFGTSYFDMLWRQKGRLIRYFHFKKR